MCVTKEIATLQSFVANVCLFSGLKEKERIEKARERKGENEKMGETDRQSVRETNTKLERERKKDTHTE